MKSTSLTVSPSRNRVKIQVSNPFTWATARKFYNALPGAVTPCPTTYDAKMYTVALLGALSIAFLPLLVIAWFVYNSARKGGKSK